MDFPILDTHKWDPTVDGEWLPLLYMCVLWQSFISSHSHISLCGCICLQFLLSLPDLSCSLLATLLLILQYLDKRLLPQFWWLSLSPYYSIGAMFPEIYADVLFCTHCSCSVHKCRGQALLVLSFVPVSRRSLPTHWEWDIRARAGFSHNNHVDTSPIKGVKWPSGKSRTLQCWYGSKSEFTYMYDT